MEKFECRNCGACCTRFGQGCLPFFEWEIKDFIELAEQRGIKLNVQPLNPMFDKNSGLFFFPQYGVFNEPCPFLKNNKCEVYESRPLVCRMFPIIKNPLFTDEPISLSHFTFCPNFNLKEFVEEVKTEKLSQKELDKLYNLKFGECNKACFYASKIRETIDNLMLNLIKAGKVELIQAPNDSEIEAVPIMDFLVKIKALSSREKHILIRKFKKLC